MRTDRGATSEARVFGSWTRPPIGAVSVRALQLVFFSPFFAHWDRLAEWASCDRFKFATLCEQHGIRSTRTAPNPHRAD